MEGVTTPQVSPPPSASLMLSSPTPEMSRPCVLRSCAEAEFYPAGCKGMQVPDTGALRPGSRPVAIKLDPLVSKEPSGRWEEWALTPLGTPGLETQGESSSGFHALPLP